MLKKKKKAIATNRRAGYDYKICDKFDQLSGIKIGTSRKWIYTGFNNKNHITIPYLKSPSHASHLNRHQ